MGTRPARAPSLNKRRTSLLLAACIDGEYRGQIYSDDLGNSTAVSGTLQIPSPADVPGFSHTSASVGDVFILGSTLLNGQSDFVQFGWYYGSISPSLPYAGTLPEIFLGERNVNAPTGENLYALGTISTTHTGYGFKLQRQTNGTWRATFNGTYKGSTPTAHSGGNAAAAGETGNSCTGMREIAENNQTPYATLSYVPAGGVATLFGRYSSFARSAPNICTEYKQGYATHFAHFGAC